jgi:hypothetical protein
MKKLLRQLDRRHKNSKFLYYLRASLRELVPAAFLRNRLPAILKGIKDFDLDYIRDRVNYYNRISSATPLSDDSTVLGKLTLPNKDSTYYFDSAEYIRYFDPTFRAKFVFGDVTTEPDQPTILKYRPVLTENDNYVLFKLNKVRLFNYVDDKRDFRKKKDMLIGRAVVKLPPRIRFYEKYFNHPLCDLGQINRDKNTPWIKDKISIDEHLDFKFILCIEGYDVASNLRWVMSSNSLAVMPKPTCESWFMEGRLIPDHHYIQIKDDYSDLEERLNYYLDNSQRALEIIRNANTYVNQFRNKQREDLLSLLVLEKYFYRTGQLAPFSDTGIFDI